MSILVVGSCVSATGCCVAASGVSISSISKSVAGSCVSATGCCVAASGVSNSCNSTSIPVAGSCVSVTGWVVGYVSATSKTDDVWASNSCNSISVVGSCVAATGDGIGKDPGVWEDVRHISRIGGGSRVVVIQGGLIEDLVHFLRKKGGKGAICCRFRGGLS
jgi:hypothetical protein